MAGLVWLVFGQTLGYAFTDYDDGEYVYENPIVTNGLSWRSVGWAFSHAYASNWHPLTWISHMADVQLYGPFAGGHHATNVLLHSLAAMLLFLALRGLTGAFWRCAFVAAVFAIHPLRAESVAWVAERKEVLSGVFFMLTLSAYARYARAASGKSWYAATCGFLALGLSAKPSLVTLPCVLLLLDYWPLGRFGPGAAWRLVMEKLPLFALSAASCVATLFAQTQAMMSISILPPAVRVANAALGYVTYLWQMIYPVDLAVLYPIHAVIWWQAALALALLLLVSTGVFACRRRQPWLAVGWLWFLGVLVPMIGLVQVGSQSHADRYTYLSQIGLYIAVTWTLAQWAGAQRTRRVALGAAAGVVLAVLAACTYRQVTYWRNSETLWRHTLACTTRNAFAHNLLAVALGRDGRQDEAFAEFQKSLHINPKDAGTQFYLGLYLAKHGRTDEAIRRLRLSLRLAPQNPGAETNLGLALANQGRTTEARLHYHKALEYEPDFLEAENDLAWTLATDPDPAKRDGSQALALARHTCDVTNYKDANYLDTLAAAEAEAGHFSEAVRRAQAVLALPGSNAALKQQVAEHLAAYRENRPWHEAGADPAL